MIFPFGGNTGAAGRGERGKKLTKMKKQFLLLAIFTLAVFAGTTAYGQQLDPSPYSSIPNTLANCVGSPQQPKAGIPYTYEFDNTDFGAGGPPTGFRFWATKDPNFVSGTPTITNQTTALTVVSGDLLATSTNYNPGSNDATDNVEITWGPDLLARTSYQTLVGSPGTLAAPTSTFVVGWATNGCTDNIKVWEIDPSPSFTVDIKVIADGTKLPLPYGDATATQCIDEVRAAKYNTTNFNVDYNFGWDTLYYEVIAANFVTSWVPTFFLTGLGDAAIQDARIDWYESWSAARTNATTAAAGWIEGGDITGGTVTGTTAITSNAPNTNGGVSMIVRVVVSNNNYEGLTAQTIGLSVAGEDAVGFDIDDDLACTVPANAADAADDDTTSRTITPRPTLQEGTTIILPVGGIATP